jgi:hypothetical protein
MEELDKSYREVRPTARGVNNYLAPENSERAGPLYLAYDFHEIVGL